MFTEAIHSLPGIMGYAQHGDAHVEILDKDKYGRILFFYSEETKLNCLLIAQKSDDTYVYYYPDFNFTCSSEQTTLKDKNDWNRPLDDSKFIKQKIVREKARHKLSKNDREKIFREATGYNEACYGSYLTSDEHGKKLFHCLGERIGRGICLAIITSANDSCNLATCFMVLTDCYNYQQDLKAFKELNNWSEPWAIPREQTKEAQ